MDAAADLSEQPGLPFTDVVSDLIAAMKNHVQVNLAVQDRDDEAAAREFLATRGATLDHVRFFRIPHLDPWVRDMDRIHVQPQRSTADQRLELQLPGR